MSFGPSSHSDMGYPVLYNNYIFFSLIFKSMVRTIQNKMFWKLMLKRQSPDINAINVNYEMFKNSVNVFETYFLGTKDFVGGTDLNISGAQSFTTLMADLH